MPRPLVYFANDCCWHFVGSLDLSWRQTSFEIPSISAFLHQTLSLSSDFLLPLSQTTFPHTLRHALPPNNKHPQLSLFSSKKSPPPALVFPIPLWVHQKLPKSITPSSSFPQRSPPAVQGVLFFFCFFFLFFFLFALISGLFLFSSNPQASLRHQRRALARFKTCPGISTLSQRETLMQLEATEKSKQGD